MAIVFNPFTGNFDFAGGDATASLLNLKGQVATVGALPSSGNTIGDVWQVTADLTFRVWDGAAWDNLGTFQGPAGPSVELQKTATHIQWRVVGGTWANLVALSEITGTDDSSWLALGDEPTAATAGVKMTIRHWPQSRRLVEIPLWESAPPVGSAMQLDIRVGGVSIFSTLPTIAVGGVSSTATTPAVFTAAFVSANQTIAAGSLVTFHVIQPPSGGGGAGLKIYMPAVRV